MLVVRRFQALVVLDTGLASVSDKDNRGRNALHYCAESNSGTEIAEMLIKKKKSLAKDKDKFNVTPLHLAVISGNQAMCELLLSNKADVNAVDKALHNVIHLATAHGHVELLQFLADKGAKLNRPDNETNFALHYAVQLCGNTAAAGDKKVKDKGKKAAKDKKKKRDSEGDVTAAPANGFDVSMHVS